MAARLANVRFRAGSKGEIRPIADSSCPSEATRETEGASMTRSPSVATCFLFSAAAWLSAGPATSAETTSRYTRVGPCREVGHSVEPDWILKKCGGYRGQSVWIAYTDSTKARVGFGPKQNVSGIFGIEGVETTLLEWRGSLKGESFEPFAVIARIGRPFGERKSFLVVYRLRPDGTSCILRAAESSNAKALEIADASLTNYACEEQPDVP